MTDFDILDPSQHPPSLNHRSLMGLLAGTRASFRRCQFSKAWPWHTPGTRPRRSVGADSLERSVRSTTSLLGRSHRVSDGSCRIRGQPCRRPTSNLKDRFGRRFVQFFGPLFEKENRELRKLVELRVPPLRARLHPPSGVRGLGSLHPRARTAVAPNWARR
jgi:hypothetical protein